MNPKAGIIIIGNEILSGRTLDTNSNYIASKLGAKGIIIEEVRVIRDCSKTIISTVIEFSNKFDYVFTTGGIGPTHDDITSEAIAKAFNVPLELNEEARATLARYYAAKNMPVNDAKLKMAMIPHSATLIQNNISGAPGFQISNVYVLAGVPYIMHDMLDHILPSLKEGKVILSKNIDVQIGESLIADIMTNAQNKYPEVEIGSYPFKKEELHFTSIVMRSSDESLLDQVYKEISVEVNNRYSL